MTKLLITLIPLLAASITDTPRPVAAPVRTADRIAQANDTDAGVWRATSDVTLHGLPAWYAGLGERAKASYDELRELVRRSRCFDKPLILNMSVIAARRESDGSMLLDGSVSARTESAEDYYTAGQKKRVAEMKLAIRDKQERHNHDMVRLSDGSPYKLERIQLFHDAIIEMGEIVQSLHEEFRPAALKRKVMGERVLVRVRVPAADVASFDSDKLDRLRAVRLIMDVADFHLRPPIEEFDRPVAVGMLMGKALQVGEVTYKPPMSELPDDESAGPEK